MNDVFLSRSTHSTPLASTGIACALLSFAQRCIALIEHWLTPLFDLAIRLYVASVFFKSGLTKIEDWSLDRGTLPVRVSGARPAA